GNYCESAAEHDHQETEEPIGRLTKINLHRLYGCQSNVVYGRSQLIDGLPPQVLRLILKILNYLAINHSCVADILFYFNFTRGLESLNTGIFDMNDKGKEKVLEGEEIPQPDELSIECIVYEALESPQYQSSVAVIHMMEKLYFGELAENTFSSTKSDVYDNKPSVHPQWATPII
nr:E3 ubiquitin-protein ligase UPL1-like [Tanacetum cinerariifolium]